MAEHKRLNGLIIVIVLIIGAFWVVTTIENNSYQHIQSSSVNGIQISVNYTGKWSGSINDGGSSQSVEGTGPKTFNITGSPQVVGCAFQKRDSGNKQLSASIISNGNVLKTTSTTANYGLAQVSYSFIS